MILDAFCGVDRSRGKTEKLSRAWDRAQADPRQVASIDRTDLNTKVTDCCGSASALPRLGITVVYAAHSGRTSVDGTLCGLVAGTEDSVRPQD